MPSCRPVAGLAALAAFVWLALAGAAQGHAVLLETRPPADAVLEAAPATVELIFNEPVRPLVARALDGAGQDLVPPDQVSAIDRRVVLALPEDAPAGALIVTWRVVSQDSHVVGGSYRFSVGGAAMGAVAVAQAPPGLLRDAIFVLLRGLFLAGLLATAGGLWFHLLARQAVGADRPGWLLASAGLGAVSGAALVPLAGLGMLDLPLAALLAPLPWHVAISTSLGLSLVAGSAGLGVILLGLLARPGAKGRLGLCLVGTVAALSPAATGHVAIAPPRLLATPGVALHLLAVAAWLGALPALLVAGRRLDDASYGTLLRRFSTLALPLVLLLLVAGATLAVLQVRAPGGLASPYGLLLLGKLAVVALVLLLALDNRRTAAAARSTGAPLDRRRIRRTIGLEIVGIGLVILLTAAMGRTVPPRALADAAAHAQASAHHDHHHAQGDDPQPATTRLEATDRRGRSLELEVWRLGQGRYRLDGRILDPSGAVLEPLEASSSLALPARGVEPLRRELAVDGGTLRLVTDDLSLPGAWELRVDVLLDAFDRASFRVVLAIE